MEYTKGEWRAERVATQIGHAWKIEPIHACIYVDQQYIPHDLQNKASLQAEANTHLITASPDIYEALKNIVERHEQGLALGEKMDLTPARKALAKTEGK